MALTKIMGQNFRVFVGGSAVSEAKSCQVNLQGNVEDEATKDSTGGWSQDTMTSRQWDVSVDGIDASVANMRTLISRFNSDDKVTVGWDQTAGAQNRVAQNADFKRSGQAILNDLTITANNRTTIQVSCKYQGSGALS